MMSGALRHANTAVSFERNHDYLSAISSYGAACDILRQVIALQTDEPDRQELENVVGDPMLGHKYITD
jgi:hypothetical protein